MVTLGSYGGEVRLVGGGDDDDEVAAAEEVMLLWGMQQPTSSKPNSFVAQSSLLLPRGSLRSLPIYPALLSGIPGVTGAVVWDSGVVLGKFLEHAVDSGI
ncbi:hypothetical protein MLD38_032886 [Melastoma candidum]|uniref:Uncharacterized protein n=1 Tax=Melastoma candidum TaxID=119954 RepID=A0ACB9M795_9MYRT|nr:hypothetical protein MLD38_032886 [Melastoma candidum]